MSNRTRLEPEERRLQILNAAIDVAREQGLYKVSIVNVARGTPDKCSKELVKHYFQNLTVLKTAVIAEAITRGHTYIVAQAITMRDPAVEHLTKSERQGYLKNV